MNDFTNWEDLQAKINSEIEKNSMENKIDNENAVSEPILEPITPTPSPAEQNSTASGVVVENSTENFYKETIKPHKENKASKFGRTVAAVSLAAVLGGLSVGVGLSAFNTFVNRVLPSSMGNNISEQSKFSFVTNRTGLPEGTNAFVVPGEVTLSDVIESVEPSVVAITSIIPSTQTFFNIPIEGGSGSGSGSGIIISEDNERVYIATNYHVIEGATSMRVSVTGKEPVTAKHVGADITADLAVIYVNKEELNRVGVEHIALATFGESDNIRVGEFVLAIGNALGEGNTATIGIISAKDKDITVENKNLNVLQTDAAINPGNSGGPLVNLRGEVIGINTAKLSKSLVEGMGYSISSSVAKPIIEGIMSKGPRPFLGITSKDIPSDMIKFYDLPEFGVYVNSVLEGSSADLAGIKRTDIIVGFNGRSIMTFENLTDALAECSVGQSVEVKLIRDGKTKMTVTVKLS